MQKGKVYKLLYLLTWRTTCVYDERSSDAMIREGETRFEQRGQIRSMCAFLVPPNVVPSRILMSAVLCRYAREAVIDRMILVPSN